MEVGGQRRSYQLDTLEKLPQTVQHTLARIKETEEPCLPAFGGLKKQRGPPAQPVTEMGTLTLLAQPRTLSSEKR